MNMLELKKLRRELIKEARERGSVWNYTDGSGNADVNAAILSLTYDSTFCVSKVSGNFTWYSLKVTA